MCTPTLSAAATVLERAAAWLMLMLTDGWVQQAVERLWSPSLVHELGIFIFSQIRVTYARTIGCPFVRMCHPWGVCRSDVRHCHDVSSNIHDILKVEVLHWILEGENSRGGSPGAPVRQSLVEGEAAATSPLPRMGKGCAAVALWALCVLTREALTSARQEERSSHCSLLVQWGSVLYYCILGNGVFYSSDGIINRKGLQLITIIIVD